jgi:hypothetical protein
MNLDLLHDFLDVIRGLLTMLHPKENPFPWPTFIPAVMTVLIAAVAVVVAHSQYCVARGMHEVARQQHRTAEDKLRLDLFEKRSAVYEAVKRFIYNAKASGTVSDDALLDFLRDTQGSDFLFHAEITQLIKDVWTKAHDSREADALAADYPPESEIARDFKIQALRSRRSLEVEYNQLIDKFRPYLGFSHLKHEQTSRV